MDRAGSVVQPHGALEGPRALGVSATRRTTRCRGVTIALFDSRQPRVGTSAGIGQRFKNGKFRHESAANYDWQNRVIAIGMGDRRANGPIYSIFEVL
jgi:hypothetical protein